MDITQILNEINYLPCHNLDIYNKYQDDLIKHLSNNPYFDKRQINNTLLNQNEKYNNRCYPGMDIQFIKPNPQQTSASAPQLIQSQEIQQLLAQQLLAQELLAQEPGGWCWKEFPTSTLLKFFLIFIFIICIIINAIIIWYIGQQTEEKKEEKKIIFVCMNIFAYFGIILCCLTLLSFWWCYHKYSNLTVVFYCLVVLFNIINLGLLFSYL